MAMFEEPQLGSAACDSVAVTLGYRWESGWHGQVSWRRSGSDEWSHAVFSGRDAAETHALIGDHLAAVLGLV